MGRLIQALIRFYQQYVSPMTPPSCRYEPSCSTYMYQAIDKHGGGRGLLMGLARILRCHPFVEGGHDPVPDHFTLKRHHP